MKSFILACLFVVTCGITGTAQDAVVVVKEQATVVTSVTTCVTCQSETNDAGVLKNTASGVLKVSSSVVGFAASTVKNTCCGACKAAHNITRRVSSRVKRCR